MTKKNDETEKRQTKAGMMAENGDDQTGSNDEKTPAPDSENAPKIGKDEAARRESDRPVH
jgi:hypothetical protein